MPLFGGLTPFPLRFGGWVPRLQRIVESLQTARGPIYSTSQSSAVYIENNAYARAIDRDAYGANERLANEFYPPTATIAGLLPRWETIFGIVPPQGATQQSRQAAAGAAYRRVVGTNSAQGLFDTVAGVLQPSGCFVGIVYSDLGSSGAVLWWPLNPNPTPDPLNPTPWYSTICHIDIQVQQPTGMLEGAFLNFVAQAMVTLDGLLPAWVTFDWFTTDVTAGVKGFYLDSYENLLRDAFDV
jgi:hypothetical protein